MNKPEIKKLLSQIGEASNEIRYEMLNANPDSEIIWSKAASMIASAQIVQSLTGIDTKLVPASDKKEASV